MAHAPGSKAQEGGLLASRTRGCLLAPRWFRVLSEPSLHLAWSDSCLGRSGLPPPRWAKLPAFRVREPGPIRCGASIAGRRNTAISRARGSSYGSSWRSPSGRWSARWSAASCRTTRRWGRPWSGAAGPRLVRVGGPAAGLRVAEAMGCRDPEKGVGWEGPPGPCGGPPGGHLGATAQASWPPWPHFCSPHCPR